MSQVYSSLPEGVTRETMDVDVLIVGGGAAGLSCALHLSNQIKKYNAAQIMLEGNFQLI